MPDTRVEQRWSNYTRGLDTHAVRSIHSVPFAETQAAWAALNLYTDQPDVFPEFTATMVEDYAAEHIAAVNLALKNASAKDAHGRLAVSLESRDQINTAVGIIMAQNSCSQAQALDILQRASSTRNIELRDLATSLITDLGTTEATQGH